MRLTLERCVRTRAVAASCTRCVESCPTGAVHLAGGRVAVHLDACIACGLCASACPTEAIDAGVDVPGLVAAAPRRVACGEGGVPCVGALAVEDWALLGLQGPVEVEAAPTCASAWPGHRDALARVAEANALLEAAGRGAPLSFPPPEPASPLPPLPVGGDDTLAGGALDPARIRARELPPRRQRLLDVLPAVSGTLAATFTSAKVVDPDTCTGCLACVPVCPTGALTTPRLRDALRMDGSACVRCGLCHDVCAPGALTLAPTVSLERWRSSELVHRFRVRLCPECGRSFAFSGEPLCPGCRAEDEDAHALWGLRR